MFTPTDRHSRWPILILMVLILMATTAVPALAQGMKKGQLGPNYVAVRGGYGWMQDSNRSAGDQSGSDISFESAWDINAAFGRRFFKDYLRLEIELGYIDMKLDKMNMIARGTEQDVSGYDRHFRGMFNIFFDIQNESPVTPFIGAGIGFASVRHRLEYLHPTQGVIETTDDETVLAYQFMGGLAWNFYPGWELEAMYSYHGSGDRTHDNHAAGTAPELNFDGTRGHFVTIGFRYNF